MVPFVLLVAWLFLGVFFVEEAFDDPSVWHWVRLGLWVFVVAGPGRQCVGVLSGRGADKPVRTVVEPEDVPAADVEAAVASTSDRVSAVRALREQHPAVGLKAAMGLVDRVLG
ncbi:hypothetical protein [Rhodococcus sp. ACT016]|uniref:hypothetical protein n=1 Tax=Rhodococcus sp. ACT016 TaxID=3134808 RepID=UPI003D2DC2BD